MTGVNQQQGKIGIYIYIFVHYYTLTENSGSHKLGITWVLVVFASYSVVFKYLSLISKFWYGSYLHHVHKYMFPCLHLCFSEESLQGCQSSYSLLQTDLSDPQYSILVHLVLSFKAFTFSVSLTSIWKVSCRSESSS